MAAKKAALKMGTSAGGPPGVDPKALTMMRPGELFSFDEDQRIAIFEMVKDGSMTIEEAHAEVKKTKPKQFELKFLGSMSGLAPTLKSTLTDEQGTKAITEAVARLKKIKAPVTKVKLHCSTISCKIVEELGDDENEVIENEPIEQIAYAAVDPKDKKRVAYVTSYSRLGLLWTHVFQCGKSKEALELAACINERRDLAAENVKKIKATGVEAMSANVDDEDEDDGGAIASFFCRYLGNVAVPEIQGDAIVKDAVTKMKDLIKEAGHTNERTTRRTVSAKKRLSRASMSMGAGGADDGLEGAANTQAVLVVSSEGLKTVDEFSREVISNVIIKAISYSTEIVGKKFELFAFIEVDDRRNTKTCHVYLCEKGSKGQALDICNAVCTAFEKAVEEAKARAGNPLLPMGKIRETVTGPLAAVEIPRKELIAVKAIGAGQFGKVFLATSSVDPTVQRAVKMLRSGASNGDRTEFLREAETMLNIGTHANIVSFQGAAVKQRPWLVVLEYCQYGDLSDVLKALGRRKIALTLREQMGIAGQLATGMAYVSSKRFVHMDLAARNVLLGENSLIKIADFGLTHSFDSGKDYYKQLGVLKLSIRWLAIDSFDNKIFSERSDVWSYAVTMWEVFSYGLQPYRGNKLQEVLKLVRGGGRLDKPLACPQEFFESLQKCWLVNRMDRPSFNELEAKCAAILGVLPTTIGPVRDIGKLLNADLSKKISRMSVRVAKKGPRSPEPPKGNVDEEGLTGAMDTTGTTATLKKAMPLPSEMDDDP